jgi:hypothetical protein
MIAAAVQWAKRIMLKIIWGRLTRATTLHCATWNSQSLDDFRQSLTADKPLAGLSLALTGLWWDAKSL